MQSERKNGSKLMNDLAQMRRYLDELQASMARRPTARDIERLLADMREVNERLVIASLENMDRAKAAAAEAESARQRLDAAMKLILEGVLVAEAPSGRVVLQNEQVERIWRRPLPQPSTVADYRQYDGIHPDGRPYRPEEWPLARSIQKGETVEGEEIAFTRGDATRGILLANSAPLRGKRGRVVVAIMAIHDVTGSRSAATRLARLEAATVALSEATTSDEVAGILLQEGIDALGASAGAVALLIEDGAAIRLVRDVGCPEPALGSHRCCPVDAPMPIAETVRSQRPVFLRSVEERVDRYPNLRDVGTENQAFASVPMVARGRTIGALGLSFLEPRELTGEERVFLDNLARQGALALAAIGWHEVERSIRPQADST